MEINKQSYVYYPGCSQHSTGLEYGLSTEAVFHHLGAQLNEIPDWNCCGASSAHALSHILAIALPARNLALAQQVGSKLITPCAACYNRLKGADYAIHNETGLKAEIEDILGLSYNGGFTIRPVMGALYEDYGPDRLADEVKKPLKGLKVVTYYGCLLVRPPQVTEFDNPDNPQIMSSLLRALGAEVKSWSHATDCCGAGLSLSKADVVQNLVSKLADRAREAGADALATACPLCQVNLEMRQKLEPKMPAFYITELAGLAFGLPDTDKWWRKHLIDPRPVLKQAGLL